MSRVSLVSTGHVIDFLSEESIFSAFPWTPPNPSYAYTPTTLCLITSYFLGTFFCSPQASCLHFRAWDVKARGERKWYPRRKKNTSKQKTSAVWLKRSFWMMPMPVCRTTPTIAHKALRIISQWVHAARQHVPSSNIHNLDSTGRSSKVLSERGF